MLILAINSGSSSLKCAAIDPGSGTVAYSALVESLDSQEARVIRSQPDAATVSLPGANHAQAFDAVLAQLRAFPEIWGRLASVGHRVVHGGEHFTSSVLITDEVLASIQGCVPLAPLHNPANLLGIEAARRALPHLKHVAVFDTAFHQTMPPHAYRYAVPTSWYEQHRIRRYGFHGTSHRFVATQASVLLGRPLRELNLITAHLGNGCSAAAIASGKCVDTTMGFTPLEGLVMGTRSGDLDPAIVFHLVAQGLSVADVDRTLNRGSGLLGLSGLSNDMRTLTENEERHTGAKLAIDVFCHRLAKSLGALWTNFDHVDGIVFTGGIGEHSARIRELVVARLTGLGVRADPEKNARREAFFHAPGSSCALLIVATNEELLIARDTHALTQPPA